MAPLIENGVKTLTHHCECAPVNQVRDWCSGAAAYSEIAPHSKRDQKQSIGKRSHFLQKDFLPVEPPPQADLSFLLGAPRFA